MWYFSETNYINVLVNYLLFMMLIMHLQHMELVVR